MPEEHLIVSAWKVDKFAGRIAKAIGQDRIVPTVMQSRCYKNEEFNPTFQLVDDKDIKKGRMAKGNHIYIIGCFSPDFTPNELAMRVVLAAKAAKDNGAKSVTAVFPDMPYARADRSPTEDPRLMDGKAFSLEALAQCLAWDVDKVLTVHPHSQRVFDIFGNVYSKIRGKTDGKDIVHTIDMSPVVAHYVVTGGIPGVKPDGSNLAVLAMDKGAKVFTDNVADLTGYENIMRVYCSKVREKANDPNYVFVTIDEADDIFKDMIVLAPDDGIDTGGTISNTSDQITSAASFNVYVTHAWFSGNKPDDDAQDKILDSNISQLILSNTHPDRKETLNDDLLLKKCMFLDPTLYIADAIKNHIAFSQRLPAFYGFKGGQDIRERAGNLYQIMNPRDRR